MAINKALECDKEAEPAGSIFTADCLAKYYVTAASDIQPRRILPPSPKSQVSTRLFRTPSPPLSHAGKVGSGWFESTAFEYRRESEIRVLAFFFLLRVSHALPAACTRNSHHAEA